MKCHPAERVAEYRAKGCWTEETVDGLLRAQIARRPHAPAIVDPPNKKDLLGLSPFRLTWAELDERVDRLAAVLGAYGVRQGDVVAVQLPNSVEIVEASLAIIRLGAIVTPFPVQYREYELIQLGRLAKVTAFVTATRIGDRANAEAVRALRAEIPTLRTVLAVGPGAPEGVVALDEVLERPYNAAALRAYLDGLAVDPNDCVTICWTSGTEDTPKGVPRCSYDWLAICWACVDAPRLTENDVLLNPFPMANMAGIAGMFLPWLRVGCVLAQHHPFDLPTFLAQVAEERVTYTVAPPALLSMLLAREDILGRADISSLRLIGSGSMPLSPAMVAGWQERHGIGIINFFGSNEGVALLSDPVNIPDPAERARYFPRYGAEGIRWASRIADWMSVRLVDPTSGEEIAEPGRPGELAIKGPTLFAGYLAGTGAAEPFDADGYLRTGDVFEIAGDRAQYLRYVDRAKDLIIRGGMNIAPAEVEGLLSGHPRIAECAVVGYPDEVLGERCCLFAVPTPEASLGLDEVVAYLREQRIAPYKLPERLEIVDALPRNPLGKVVKHELRDRLAPGGSPSRS
ncbi:MAG: AMP-binding protein [Streptosporangiales bacterium]|nr:AMP-binding protein [Streptosporangiales bacterium]